MCIIKYWYFTINTDSQTTQYRIKMNITSITHHSLIIILLCIVNQYTCTIPITCYVIITKGHSL